MDAYLDRELGVAALQAFRAYHTFDDIEDLYLYRRTVEAGMGRADTTLYFIEDFSYEQIADVVGCPIGTVRSRLHRSRKMLQRALWQVAVDQGLVSRPTAPEAS